LEETVLCSVEIYSTGSHRYSDISHSVFH
jgi:hypothetical protein